MRMTESAVERVMDDGLRVAVIPMPGFQKTYATLTTAFGSIDTHMPDGRKLPDGIAHFLEHQMFAMPEGDVFSMFSRKGASSNAFTSAEQTSYLFTCTDDWKYHLKTLLNFVQTPYFEPKNVDKERGIIAQEIRMIQDRPDWQAYQLMLQSRFEKHPWRIPISGTVQSIEDIDSDWLYACHAQNYHPRQLILVVCGDVEPEAVFELTAAHQADLPSRPYMERLIPRAADEYNTGKISFSANGINSVTPSKTLYHEWKLPLDKFRISFLDSPPSISPDVNMRRQMITNLALDWRFGSSAANIQPLYAKGLITDQFSPGWLNVPGAAMTVLGGDTPDPARVFEELYQLSIQPVTDKEREEFERLRRKSVASWVRLRQSPEGLAQAYIRSLHRDQDVFKTGQLFQSIRMEEVEARFYELMNWEDAALTVVGKKQVSA